MKIDNDDASIVKMQNKLYVFTRNFVYIYDINNLSEKPIIKEHQNSYQGICANENNIFTYDTSSDQITKYDQNLNVLEKHPNKYSTKDTRVSLSITCNKETFFTIPIAPSNEDEYLSIKEFMAQHINPDIAKQNDYINSCSFNYDENTLYMSMDNMIWIIRNGNEYSYLYFKDKGITSIYYDNDIKRLIINFGGTNTELFKGFISTLSDEEIKERKIDMPNVSLNNHEFKKDKWTKKIKTNKFC